MTPNLNVVLVRTIYSRNLGSVSRAMGNMGGHRLILVNPQCAINLEARQGAAGAQKHLVERTVYQNWRDFHQSELFGIKIAFCGKQKPITDPVSLSARIESLMSRREYSGEPIYLIFGPEDDGLTNTDLESVHFIQKLPTYGTFESLNLSHAVILALFMIVPILSKYDFKSTPHNTAENFYFPTEALEAWLQTLGFRTDHGPKNALSVLQRILLSHISTPKELRVLAAIIHQTVRKLNVRSPQTPDGE